MKKSLLIFFLFFASSIFGQTNNIKPTTFVRTIGFDNNWLFRKDSAQGAEQPQFNDTKWRLLDLPHDWSIEDLPNQTPDSIAGPFDRNSPGQSATGFTVGGTGWYRKKFISENSFQKHFVTIHFDGVYMNSDVWLNGH